MEENWGDEWDECGVGSGAARDVEHYVDGLGVGRVAEREESAQMAGRPCGGRLHDAKGGGGWWGAKRRVRSSITYST